MKSTLGKSLHQFRKPPPPVLFILLTSSHRLGYLPVKTSSKGEIEAIPPAASPSLSPQRTASSKQDTTEKLVDRLNEVETRSGSDESSSTRVTPQQHSEPARKFLGQNGTFSDEHSLIAQYCQKLHNGDLISSVPDSPLSLMAEIDAEQRHELEMMIRELETENADLQEEYKHLQASTNSNSSGAGSSAPNSSSSTSTYAGNGGNGVVPPMTSEAEILHEAKMLREHKDRLESRMKLLAVHNNQLEMQLGKLRTLLDPNPPSQNGSNGGGLLNNSIISNKTGTLNTKSVNPSQLATNSPILPHKMNGNKPEMPPSKEPPALPPRGVSIRGSSRDSSINGRKPPPPAVPPKRSSLTRSDLALFSAATENVSFGQTRLI